MLVLRHIDLRKPAGGGRPLRNGELEVRRGEFLRLSGGPGSAEAGLLRVLGLIEAPDSGSYLLEGREVLGLPETELAALRARHFGYLFARDRLPPELDALHNLLLPMSFSRMPRGLRRRRALELLGRFGLGDRAGVGPRKLSPGERRRLALARALANDPNFLLVEEGPPEGDEDLGSLLEELHGEGLGILILGAGEGR